MKKIIIFGGTFDPPHKGHTETARYLLNELSPDLMLVFPAGIPPHKRIGSDSLPADRFKMAKLAFEPLESQTGVTVVVSDRELRRPGKSYTFDTVSEVKEIYPESEIFLYIGSDMTESFDKWYRYEDILKMCRIVTAKRYSGRDEDKLFYEKCEMINSKGIGITVLDKDVIVSSSTDIRKEMKKIYEMRTFFGYKNENIGEKCPSLLTESIFRYIISKNMYK
ncbi:MAG: nicotinate (nicotinamide) nucleotide adenylyltransferase [Ruminococcaceae bacterium]|nr:nicotinate (nicotinamide) nucleotide adenylyltransferase [Oscillospiraceae bacterium]